MLLLVIALLAFLAIRGGGEPASTGPETTTGQASQTTAPATTARPGGTGGNLRLPDTVGGLQRIDLPEVEQAMQSAFQPFLSGGTVQGAVLGVYGQGGGMPAFMLLGIQPKEENRGAFLLGLEQGLLSQVEVHQRFQLDGVEFQCGQAKGQQTPVCVFADQEIAGMGGGVRPDFSLQQLSQLTNEGRKAMKGAAG